MINFLVVSLTWSNWLSKIPNLKFVLSFHWVQPRPGKLLHWSVTQFIYLYNEEKKKKKACLTRVCWTLLLFQNLKLLNINLNNSSVWGYYFLSKHPSRKRCKGSQSFPAFLSLQSFFSKEHNKETKSQTHWLTSFSKSVVVNLLLHKKLVVKLWTPGFGRPRVEKCL